MALSPQWLDELRARTTLSTLIGRTVKIQKAGREYKACCPFHNEKTPSFTINDEKGFYHCFGCSAHGDVISWMVDQRGLGFMDAVKELAAEAGMQVPTPDPRAAQKAEQQAGLHDVMAAAQDWFAERLHDIEGSGARAYLEQRGLSQRIIREFGFGYAPDARGRVKQALSGFNQDMLVEAGMMISVDGKAPYDRFRGRLMIPIRDPRGRVIAFGGRILGQGEPKYLNSPDTPLFDKGRTLYNLDKASPASRQTGRILVVEGYMDAIALSQAGFEDVVAPLGTALTEFQIEKLWKMAETPILCFDGDAAGQKAAMRAARRALPMLRAGHSLKIVSLPDGMDPDDLVKKSGPSAFQELLDSARGLLDHIWQYEYAREPLDTPEAKASLKSRLMEHVSQIGDSDVRGLYRQEFQSRFDEAFYARAQSYQPRYNSGTRSRKITQKRPVTDDARAFSRRGKSDALCAAILAGLIHYPDAAAPHIDTLSAYQPGTQELAKLLNAILDALMDTETLDTPTLLTILAERGLSETASHIMRADQLTFSFNRPARDLSPAQPDAARRDLSEAIAVMTARPALEEALAEATRRFENELDEKYFAEQQRLRTRKTEFDRRLAELADHGSVD
ncbi:DNA primase [Sphingorhabdus sp. Alg239-R122]|uniref:DNA primase n=1 Tax=Sphingorhabdus sp. Alg239-R122 TaxID=2305989 RepID=UPI0013DABAC7|nr:DNA primase [Sphingorhabdus sp. Alg239-R122]